MQIQYDDGEFLEEFKAANGIATEAMCNVKEGSDDDEMELSPAQPLSTPDQITSSNSRTGEVAAVTPGEVDELVSSWVLISF